MHIEAFRQQIRIYSSIVADKGISRLLVFNLVFFTGMWASKFAQPLWFAVNHHLLYFSLSYTAMAIAGIFSVVTSSVAKRFGLTLAARIGCIVYACGMSLRIFAHSLVLAVASGFIAGIGASTTMVVMRPWLVAQTNGDNRSHVLALRNIATRSAQVVGMASAGFLVSQVVPQVRAYRLVLLGAACLPLLAAFLIPNLDSDEGETTEGIGRPVLMSVWQSMKAHQVLSLGTMGFNILAGLVVGFVVPYLPVILRAHGMGTGLVGLTMSAGSVASAVLQPIIGSKVTDKVKFPVFFVAELVFGLLTLAISLKIGTVTLVLVMILRSPTASTSGMAEELLEISIFPAALLGFFYGLVQTSFSIGDMVGAPLGALLAGRYGIYVLPLLAGGLVVSNSILFTLFAKRRSVTPIENVTDSQTR